MSEEADRLAGIEQSLDWIARELSRIAVTLAELEAKVPDLHEQRQQQQELRFVLGRLQRD